MDDNSLPPAVPESIGDAEALQEIFASLSPVRGYHIAIKSPAPLPAIGTDSVSPPFSKFGHHPISALTKKVQKQLSESRLSKKSSKNSTERHESHELAKYGAVRSNSPRVTEADDLLASRNVSKGGYDPDAKGIKTPSVRQPSAGSIQISPKYLSKILKSLKSSPERTSSDSSGSISVNKSRIAADLEHPSSTALQEDDQHASFRLGDRRLRAQSSPTPDPATPHRMSFSAALEFGTGESPKDAIRRLHESVKDNNTAAAEVSAQEPSLWTSLADDSSSWRLSFSAPPRASSVGRRKSQKRPAIPWQQSQSPKDNHLTIAKEPEVKHKRSSVFTENDDSMLGAISTFLIQQSPPKPTETCDEEQKLKGTLHGISQELDLLDHSPLKTRTQTNASIAIQPPDNLLNTPTGKQHPALESERQSVHLCNMRISQRLASTSISNMRSPEMSRMGSIYSQRSPTNHSSLNKLSSIDGPSSLNPVERQSKDGSEGGASASQVMAGGVRSLLSPDDASSLYVSQRASLPPSRGSQALGESIDGQLAPPKMDIGEYLADLKQYQSMSNISNADEGSWFRRDTFETMRSSTESFRARELAASDRRFGEKVRVPSVPKSSRFVEEFATSQDGRGARSRAGSEATRSTSDGWLSSGKRQGYGYDFVEDQKPVAETVEQDRAFEEDTAASVWERTLRKARDSRQLGGSRSSFGSSLRPSSFQHDDGRIKKQNSQYRFTKNGLLTAGPPKRKLSKPNRDGSSMEILGSIKGGRSPMTRSVSPGISVQPKKSESVLRRYTNLGFNLGATARAASWTRFPSHSRRERTGAAGAPDKIVVRDFSPITETSITTSGADNYSTSMTPDSAMHARLTKMRRKSRSMTFGRNTAKRVWKSWVGKMHRSQSSDLKMLSTSLPSRGHRSSISAGRKVEFPELEIIPGFGGYRAGVDGSGFEDEEEGEWEEKEDGIQDEEEGEVKEDVRARPMAIARAMDMSLDGGRSLFTDLSESGHRTEQGEAANATVSSHPALSTTVPNTPLAGLALDLESSPSYFTARTHHDRQSDSAANVNEIITTDPKEKSPKQQSEKQSERQEDSYVDMSVPSSSSNINLASDRSAEAMEKHKRSISGVLSDMGGRSSGSSKGIVEDGWRREIREEENRSRGRLLEIIGGIGIPAEGEGGGVEHEDGEEEGEQRRM